MLAKSDGALACKSVKRATRTRATVGDLLRDASDYLARLRRIVKSWRRGIGRRRWRPPDFGGQFLRDRLSLFPGQSFTPRSRILSSLRPVVWRAARCERTLVRVCPSNPLLPAPRSTVPPPSPPVSRSLAVKLGGQTDIRRRRACSPSPRRRRNGQRGRRRGEEEVGGGGWVYADQARLRGEYAATHVCRRNSTSRRRLTKAECSGSIIVIMSFLFHTHTYTHLHGGPRAWAFDDSESNWPDMYDSPGDAPGCISMG